jgi:hypothetical protein
MSARAAALAAFPELRHLLDLRDAGWHFFPRTDVDGELFEVRGVRTWPGSGTADAIMVRYTTDAAALRTNDDGMIVWQPEGGLAEVVEGLITLSPPGTPGIPSLIKINAGWLWTP